MTYKYIWAVWKLLTFWRKCLWKIRRPFQPLYSIIFLSRILCCCWSRQKQSVWCLPTCYQHSRGEYLGHLRESWGKKHPIMYGFIGREVSRKEGSATLKSSFEVIKPPLLNPSRSFKFRLIINLFDFFGSGSLCTDTRNLIYDRLIVHVRLSWDYRYLTNCQ